ncbi:hypothetical protein AURDEDRAFT_128795 [Auricularia subglabra TFB-10046 SS5]|nr:hypothetical protein AURDEDRAFT_128795 [Auricularia subglabra TFB-10046 SS5]
MLSPVPALRPDFTQTVPAELLIFLLRDFTFHDLLPLLAVCKRWREIALNVRSYWSFIQLKYFTSGQVNLFLTRLSRAGAKAVSLSMNIRLVDPDLLQMQSTILSALREHLHHVKWLLVFLRGPDAPALWRSLDVAAPMLRYLAIRVDAVPASIALPVAPEGLFAAQAPSLRSATLGDIALPPEPLPAFSRVTKIETRYATARALPNIFHQRLHPKPSLRYNLVRYKIIFFGRYKMSYYARVKWAILGDPPRPYNIYWRWHVCQIVEDSPDITLPELRLRILARYNDFKEQPKDLQQRTIREYAREVGLTRRQRIAFALEPWLP